jgi:hypothetical protein
MFLRLLLGYEIGRNPFCHPLFLLTYVYVSLSTASSAGGSAGFDSSSYMTELSRLRLSNQMMSITVQVVDETALAGEQGLGLGIASCKREGVLPVPVESHSNSHLEAHDGETAAAAAKRSPRFYQYFDAGCLWSHLHPYDDRSGDRDKFRPGASASASAAADPSMIQHLASMTVIVDSHLSSIIDVSLFSS